MDLSPNDLGPSGAIIQPEMSWLFAQPTQVHDRIFPVKLKCPCASVIVFSLGFSQAL